MRDCSPAVVIAFFALGFFFGLTVAMNRPTQEAVIYSAPVEDNLPTMGQP